MNIFTSGSGLYLLKNQITNKRIRPFFDEGIYDYKSGQINLNSSDLRKYILNAASGATYSKLNGYNILNDISFIPLQSYLGHIYTGLYSGKEPIEYEVGMHGLPKITGDVILGENSYIDYKAKSYRYNPVDPYYQAFLPESGESHVLILDLNLYGFEEDKIEDCDIELNATIIKTGFFHNIPKNPSILNLEIIDLKEPIGITDNVQDYINQKRILQNFETNSQISYDNSYLSNLTSPNEKYRFIKNEIVISPPAASYNKNIALPCLFRHKSSTNNLNYDVGEYGFFIYDSSESLQSGYYITGTNTGFLYFLSPGTYTTIISGNEIDFLYNENSLSGKNQNTHLISMDVNFVSDEKLQDIYIENQDKIWATYFLGSTELMPGSGFNALNAQDPVAFTIDFERNISGQLESPFLFYREYSGVYRDLCTPIIVSVGLGKGCSTSFCLICDQATKLYNQGERFIDVPKQYIPIRTYGNLLTYYDPDPSPSTYRIAIDQSLLAECCACREVGCSDVKQKVVTKTRNQNLAASGISTSGTTIDSGIFFIDDLNAALINIKYNLNYHSGQIAFNNFYEGDKIKFKQYPFKYDETFQDLYGYKPIIKEYTTEFIFSNSSIGNNYFSGKQDLINKINYKLASSGLFSWKPLKYYPTPQYEYGPLLTGIDGGVDASGNSIINIVSLRSGKFGSHKIELDLQPRLEIYNYLVPKIMRLEISDDYINWTGVATSENRLPVNLYIKNPNALVTNEIPYEEIENTKYPLTVTVPISSETELINNKEEEEEDLEALASQFESGNIVSGETICIFSPGSSGKICGSGYKDFELGSLFSFQCKTKEFSEEDLEALGSGKDGLIEKEPQQLDSSKGEDSKTITQEINRFRISYYDYLSEN
jgi:hypothetical protein